jgi:carbon monoxide dehydrogenase subunit G
MKFILKKKYLFYIYISSWRDLCATSLREISDDLCYVVMTSVIDEQVPEKSDHVRANLILSGWKFEKVEEGVRVTYVNQIDLAGYIPQFFLTSIQQQVPACAGKVVDYIQEFGFAPTTESCTAEFKVEEFDHKKKEYTAQLAGKGECSWLVSKKMYPSSFDIKIIGSGGNAPVEMDVQENGNTLVSVKEISGPTTVKITKA